MSGASTRWFVPWLLSHEILSCQESLNKPLRLGKQHPKLKMHLCSLPHGQRRFLLGDTINLVFWSQSNSEEETSSTNQWTTGCPWYRLPSSCVPLERPRQEVLLGSSSVSPKQRLQYIIPSASRPSHPWDNCPHLSIFKSKNPEYPCEQLKKTDSYN